MIKNFVHFLSLFGSFGTLFCCALPVFFVSLGMGAVFASLTASIPQIYWITEYKEWLFLITGVLLALSWLFIKNAQTIECPIDDRQQKACGKGKLFSKRVFQFSVVLYGVGLAFSYMIPLMINYFSA